MLVVCALLGSESAPTAAASTLSRAEYAELEAGRTVTLRQSLEGEDSHYVGGLTYTVLEASTSEIESLIDDVQAYKRVLPKTKAATLVGRDQGDMFVELRQGNSLVEASYTLRIRKTAGEARFWLDHSRPHGISDAWGFFRWRPLAPTAAGAPRLLLTYGILVDVGPGIVRTFFEEKVRALMLSVPQLVRRHLASLPRAPQGA